MGLKWAHPAGPSQQYMSHDVSHDVSRCPKCWWILDRALVAVGGGLTLPRSSSQTWTVQVSIHALVFSSPTLPSVRSSWLAAVHTGSWSTSERNIWRGEIQARSPSCCTVSILPFVFMACIIKWLDVWMMTWLCSRYSAALHNAFCCSRQDLIRLAH